MQLANIMNNWAKMHEGLNLEPEFTDVMFEVENLEISLNDFKSREDDMEVVINEQNRIIEKLESDKKALLAFFEDKAIPAFILATHDYPVSLGPAGTLKEAEDLLLQVKYNGAAERF